MTRIGDGFAVNTYAYTQSMSAAETLRHLADQGVRDVELMFFPGHLWVTDTPGALAEIARVVAERGMRILSVNGPKIDLNIAAATEVIAHIGEGDVEAVVVQRLHRGRADPARAPEDECGLSSHSVHPNLLRRTVARSV